jgi:uncharacterized membrane protein HdeD (DUF308 family)
MAMFPRGGMVAALARKWWVFLVQGIVMIALGFLAFSQPDLLIRFIGAYAIVDGVLKIFSGLGEQPDDRSRWPALIIGAISIIIGLVIWANPIAVAEIVTYLIAAWAIVVGVLLIIWALRLRQEISDEWLLFIFGALSILFGLLVFANVEAGVFTLQLIFGIFAIVGGILAIILAFRVRSFGVRIGAVG